MNTQTNELKSIIKAVAGSVFTSAGVHKAPSNAALGSPVAGITTGTIIITVPNIIAEIARVQNGEKLKKKYCDKNACSCSHYIPGEKIRFLNTWLNIHLPK